MRVAALGGSILLLGRPAFLSVARVLVLKRHRVRLPPGAGPETKRIEGDLLATRRQLRACHLTDP
jgi:hypothetical protein